MEGFDNDGEGIGEGGGRCKNGGREVRRRWGVKMYLFCWIAWFLMMEIGKRGIWSLKIDMIMELDDTIDYNGLWVFWGFTLVFFYANNYFR